MSKQEYIAAWLTDEYARLFLGVSPATDTSSRWVAVGERHGDEPLGLWINLKRAEEQRANGKRGDLHGQTDYVLAEVKWHYHHSETQKMSKARNRYPAIEEGGSIVFDWAATG